VIGHNVRIYSGGHARAKRFEVSGGGELLKSYPRHPIVEDDVVIYAGATILGRITIGVAHRSAATSGSRKACRRGAASRQAKTQANESGHSI